MIENNRRQGIGMMVMQRICQVPQKDNKVARKEFLPADCFEERQALWNSTLNNTTVATIARKM